MRRLPLYMVAIALLVSAFVSGDLSKATPQYGRVGFATVSHSSAATADTIATLTGQRRIVVITNSLNTETILTYNGANWAYLPASVGVAIDLSASGLTFDNGKIIGIYYLTAQPTAGSIGISAE